MRDFQKQKVYNWESEVVSPYDKTIIPFEQIESIVKYVWSKEGLDNPPVVEQFRNGVTRKSADATRMKVRFQCATYTWIILHELAHSMTSDFEKGSNMHCEDFVGVYMHLLNKYLNIPIPILTWTATQRGIKYNFVKPYMW